LSGLGPAYPFSRRESLFSGRATPAFTPRGSPSITRTHSTSAPPLIVPIPVVTPIDLSSLGILPTDEATKIVERFNAFATEAFNPETPVEMSNFGPDQPPAGNAPQNPEQQQQQPFNPYPAVDGRERSRQLKDFNGDESKYKLWIQMVENYLIANAQRFSTDQLAILFAISYMTEGRAADWASHYIDTHQTDGKFLPTDTWVKFKKLLEKSFDIRKTKQKAQTDFSVLKQKPGHLEEYILDFRTLVQRAGFVLQGVENPMLAVDFLRGLHPMLRVKIVQQKNAPTTLEEIIEDARAFDQSYYQSIQWKDRIMGWTPRPAPHTTFTPRTTFNLRARDPNAMDIDSIEIDRLSIEERDRYMRERLCFRCGKLGHMSRDHMPSLTTSSKGSTPSYSKPATPYKAIMPPPSKAKDAARKVCAIMSELNNEELEGAKKAFIESIDDEIVEEEHEDF